MKAETIRLFALGVAALIVLVSGVVLMQSGKPYGTALLTAHKLVDLGIVVAIGVVVFRAQKAAPLAGGTWAVLGATAALAVAAFVSGGILSAAADPPVTALWVHRIGSWFAAAGMAVSAWMLMR